MAQKNFITRIQNKRDTSSNWEQANPTLLEGELIVVDTAAGAIRFKVGEEGKTYSQIPFTDETILQKFTSYLPLTGGTLTGALRFSSADSSVYCEIKDDNNIVKITNANGEAFLELPLSGSVSDAIFYGIADSTTKLNTTQWSTEDVSGLNQLNSVAAWSQIGSTATGTFPTSSNANAVLSIDRNSTSTTTEFSQLGFNDNGNLYYRAISDSEETNDWKQIAFVEDGTTVVYPYVAETTAYFTTMEKVAVSVNGTTLAFAN